MNDRKRLTVAVPTFRRPAELADLLSALGGQVAAAAAARDDLADIEILVVDNDPEESAAHVVQASPVPARYVAESGPGVVAVRNRAFDECPDRDLLAFIDDDELPRDGWLTALVRTWADHDADLVSGAVVAEFDATPDPWLVTGQFFVRRRLKTGTSLTVAACGNLLLDLQTLRRTGIRFDPRYGLTGGEDTLFSKQLLAAGGTMVWCDEAVVVDRVPVSRMTRSWVLKRALSSGNSAALTDLDLAAPGPRRLLARGRSAGGGLVRMVAGAGRSLAGRVTGSDWHDARGRRACARGVGMVLGAFGVRYREYRRKAAGTS